MKIIGLKTENIKTIKLVEIRPNGSVIKLSGKNGAGKSTVMDSIAYALGGKRLIPDVPIRDGEDTAKITVELDDLTVVRSFKRAKEGDGYTTTIKVTAKDGAAYGKAQDVLDKITGKLSFDPFAFSTMTEKEQGDLLKSMVDLDIDLEKWDSDYKKLYEQRTIAGREADRLKSVVNSMVKHEGVPETETPASAIATEYQEAINAKDHNSGREKGINEAIGNVDYYSEKLAEAQAKLDEWKKNLAEREAQPLLDVPDLTEIKTRMDSIEDVNAKVRANAERSKVIIEANAAIKAHKDADKAVADKVAEKETAIKNAVYPVDGLKFSDTGLLYNGTPLTEASSGQKIKVSALIGMALNPELRVLFIRNASLIDSENFAILESIAADKDYQIWEEFMDETGEVGIFLEDGEVK